jgi:hypothetical protein
MSLLPFPLALSHLNIQIRFFPLNKLPHQNISQSSDYIDMGAKCCNERRQFDELHTARVQLKYDGTR